MKLTAGVITGFTNPGIDTLLANKEFDYVEVDAAALGFDLPKNFTIKSDTSWDILFVEDSLYQVLEKKYPGQYNAFLSKLRARTKKDLVIAVAGRDWFQMSNPPVAYEEVDLILKTSGVFKDKELYNFVNGACSTDRNWLSKENPLEEPYSTEILDKLVPSYPCFISTNRIVRRRVRKVLPNLSLHYQALAAGGDFYFDLYRKASLSSEPRKFLHCVGGITHYQRIEVMKMLREFGFDGDQWLTAFNRDYLWEFGRRPLTEDEKESIRETCREFDLFGERISRNAFKRSMLDHQVILAPTGYGELTFRHAEAWQMKRTLLCQDLSHVDIMYPLEEGVNVVYCKSDFSDLKEVLNRLKDGEIDAVEIAANGYKTWKEWNDVDAVFEQGVNKHVRNLLN